MSRREDVLKVMRGEKPEYVPWFADLDYWFSYLQAEHMIPEKYLKLGNDHSRALVKGFGRGMADEGIQQFHKDLEAGFYLQGYFPFKTVYHNVKTEVMETKEGILTRHETPYGVLQEYWKYVPSTYSLAPAEHMIKSADDLKAFRYLYENVEYIPNYELAEKRKETIGDNGILVTYTPKTPMMELVALKAGLETVVTDLLSDEPEETEELLECMKEKHTQAAKISIAAPGDAVFIPDNLSSEMVGGSIYDNYIKEVHEDWTSRIRTSGKKSMVHLDGTLNPLLHKLSYAGFDIIEAVTPYPVGDIKLEDLRSHVKEDTIIWGGLPGGFFSESFPEAEFEEWVKQVLSLMRKDHRFVMGVADQVVPLSSPDRIRKVARLVEQYGKFNG